jgi:uncharacterized membrane protein
MNGLATVIACYGLLSNSAVVVIGAMVVAMSLGPIEGLALRITDKERKLLRVRSIFCCTRLLMRPRTICIAASLIARRLDLQWRWTCPAIRSSAWPDCRLCAMM